jgi:hypothetical protein
MTRGVDEFLQPRHRVGAILFLRPVLLRLRALLDEAAYVPIKRRPTKPTRSSQLKRVETKVQRGQVKALRRKVID